MDEVDRLYALPPGEFVSARDELAKRLRNEGDKEAAAEVKALKRPTVAAAALNRAVREQRELVEELLAASGNLRRAHERLVAGKGDRAVLREATEHARDVVSRLTAEAGAGQSDAVVERIRATLQAASVDAELAAAVASGRLEREAEAGGFLPVAAGGGGGPRERAGAKDRASTQRASTQRAAEDLRVAREAARDRLRAAQRSVREAERAAETAIRRADRAEEAAAKIRAQLEEAEEAAAAALEDADAARSALRVAKEACAAAQATLGEAETRR